MDMHYKEFTNIWLDLQLIFSCNYHMCNLLQCLVTLDKSHKILVAKKKCGTKLQRQLHKDVTYMNFSSILTSFCGIVILRLILPLKNAIALFII
jgi:hypothetical protein